MNYEEWFEFNKAQQGHKAILDNVIAVSFMILVAGLKHPITARNCGLTYLFGRLCVDIPH